MTAGLAGPGPYEFGRASNGAKAVAAHLVIPTSAHLLVLSNALGADTGTLLPTEPAVGGATDAFTLWLQ